MKHADSRDWCDATFVPWQNGSRIRQASWAKVRALDAHAAEMDRRYRVYVDCDWLDPDVAAEDFAALLDLIGSCTRVTFLLRTARPKMWQGRIRWVRDWVLSQLFQVEIAESVLDGWRYAYPNDCAKALEYCRTKIQKERQRDYGWATVANLACAWTNGDFETTILRDGTLVEDYVPPENVEIGGLVTDQETVDVVVPDLLMIPAKVHFLSCALRESVDLGLRSLTWEQGATWRSRWILLPEEVRGIGPYASLVAKSGVYRAHSNRFGALSVDASNGLETQRLGVRPDEFECLGGVDWILYAGECGLTGPAGQLNVREQCADAQVPFFRMGVPHSMRPEPLSQN